MPESSPLFKAFFESPNGLCGQLPPISEISKMEQLETRLHLITLGNIIDNTPNLKRWKELITLEDHWLLDSSQVAYKTSQQIAQALKEEKIRSPQHIARVWWQICRGIQGRFAGSIHALLKNSDANALSVQNYLHQSRTTFPVLSAPITSARWLDMIHRAGKIQLTNWGKLRVALPEKQKKAALLFGIHTEQLHPSISLALHVWESSCLQLEKDVCGLQNCPKLSPFE